MAPGNREADDRHLGYRIYQGSESRGWFRDHFVTPDQTSYWLNNLPTDLHYFAVTAVDNHGRESVPTSVGYKRITDLDQQGG